MFNYYALRCKKPDLFFLGDHFWAKSGHWTPERGLVFHTGVFYAHILNGKCGAVTKAAHTIHTFPAMNGQPVLHVYIPNRADLRAALAGGTGIGVN